jgi:glycosyltransferase involved in cell wall biosynthesis
MPTLGRSAPRRLLFDASSVTQAVDGLSTYVLNLLRHFPEELLSDVEISVLLDPRIERDDLSAALNRGYRVLEGRIPSIGPFRDLAMRRFLRDHHGEFELIHIPSMTYPFTMTGGICTIHDVTFRRWFHRKRGIPGSAKAAQIYLSAMIQHCLRNADRIISVSHATKDELGTQFRLSPAMLDKITVIHEGWEHIADHSPSDCPKPAVDADYIFFLGTFRVHKNLTNLLDAFRRAMPDLPPTKRLVISGTSHRMSDMQRAIVEAINAACERVVFTGYLSDSCVARYYANADAFIFPSLAEGFGLPVLEAFYHGAPLLAANATSLPEVAGDAALYFDPFDPGDIARAMVQFYRDPTLSKTLARLGRDRLKRFSWISAAQRTADVYRDMLHVG